MAITKLALARTTDNNNIDRIDDCSLDVARAQSLLRALFAASDGESFKLLAHSDVLNTLETISELIEKTRGSLRRIDLAHETTH